MYLFGWKRIGKSTQSLSRSGSLGSKLLPNLHNKFYATFEDSHNPIFKPTPQGWDSGSIRLDSVLYIAEEDSYYIYYSGTTGSIQDHIGLAIVKTGEDGYSNINEHTIVRYGRSPIVSPDAAAPYLETMTSQGAVYRDWNSTSQSWHWYLYYSYRGSNGTLPGIRLAISRDGKHWEKDFNFSDPREMGHIFESNSGAYYEWHQIFKVGSTYVLSMEVGPEHGKRWRAVLATSQFPDHGWAQLDENLLLQTQWKGFYRDSTIYHVATPAWYQINGKWHLFAQACSKPMTGNYIDGHWELWVFEIDINSNRFPYFE